MKRIASSLILISIVGVFTCLSPVLAEETTSTSMTAPNFELQDQDGKTVKLTDFAGKIVVLEWTNPECPFVKRHYQPDTMTMVKLAKSYKDQPVVWLAINSTSFHNMTTDKAWHDQHKLPYPVLDDHLGVVGRLYGATNTPNMFVINRQGKIAYHGAIDSNPRGGDGTVNYVKEAVDALLAGKTPATTQTKPYGCTVKYAK